MKAHQIAFFSSCLLAVWVSSALAGAGPKDDLREALASLDSELRQNPERREAWRKALRVPELEAELDEKTDDVDIDKLESIQRLFIATEVPPSAELMRKAVADVKAWLAYDDGDEESDDEDEEGDDEDEEGDDEDEEEKLIEDASAAVDAVFRRLSSSRTSLRTWDQVLHLKDLLSELAEYEDADRNLVAERLTGLEAESEASDRTRFVNVRRALNRWRVELKEPVHDDLAIAARRAKMNFHPVDAYRTDQALTYLFERLRLLDIFFSLDADWKREGWEKYLQLSTLQRELAQPPDARRTVLLRALALFDSGVIGLQKPPFRNTRDALENYIELLRVTEGTPHRLIESRQRLDAAVNLLDRFLIAGGERKEKGWKKFLNWDNLTEEMLKPIPSVRVLRRVLGNFESGEDGLDTTPFELAGRRLGKYIELRLINGSITKPVDIYEGKLDRLAVLLDAHAASPQALSAADISQLTNWLTATGLATDLVDRIRSRYSHDNVFGSVSGELVSGQVEDVVTDRQPVNRMLDGAHVCGTATTRANISGQLVPSPNMAVLDILLNGQTSIATTGRKRRVSVHATGTTWLSGQKRLYFDLENGLRSSPATASANTQQTINSVDVNRVLGRRVISRIATRKAWQSVPKAKWIANNESRQKIAEQMDTKAEPMIAKANTALQDKVKTPLSERGFRSDMLSLSSSSSHVEMRAKLTPTDYFGAPSGPPVWNRSDDVAICLHESAINNSLASYFGGLRIDNENIIEILTSYGLEIPESLRPKEGEKQEYWSMTFDLHHPISVAIGVNRIFIRFMGSHFEQGDNVQDQRIRIGASYKVNWHRHKLPDVERDGEVEVEFVDSPSGEKLNTRQIAAKTFILGKVGGVLADKIDLNDLDVEEFQPVLDAITLNRASLYKGWFAATFDVDENALPKDLDQ